ncbi:MAG: hypothetical protein R6V15_14445, partial [Desulfotignum sp.]
VSACTKEEFQEEVKAQILRCGALDEMIREANQGKGLQDFSMMEIEVWHEWEFSAEGIRPYQPKWVNSTTTQHYMPPQTTPLANLFLAGSHSRPRPMFGASRAPWKAAGEPPKPLTRGWR